MCERGTICQWKIYKRSTFSARMLYERVKGWTSGGVSPYKNIADSPPPPPPTPRVSESHLSMFVEGKSPCFVSSISAVLWGRARAQSFPNSGWYSSLPALKLIEKLVLLSKPITSKNSFTCVFLPSTSVTLMHFPRVDWFTWLSRSSCHCSFLWLRLYSIYLMLRCKAAWLSSTVTLQSTSI